jgi:hypothetical protein
MTRMTERDLHSAGTLGGLRAARRREVFVGREAEVDLFRSALDDDGPTFRVLFVHGPAGVGKTTLLGEYAAIAEAAGAGVARVDGRTVAGTPNDVLDALVEAVDVPDGGAPIRSRSGGPLVLLVDGYEQLDHLDSWVRDRLLPRLPASTRVVLASRGPPRPAWRADPGWSEVLRVVSLRNLDPGAARVYLDRRDVPAGRQGDVLAVTHGHPLTLSLVVDVITRDPDAPLDTVPVELMTNLLQQLVKAGPSPAHRQALGVAAVARTTTEGLLRDVLDDPGTAAEVFDWLLDLSVTEAGPDGLWPHDLVRDLLDADLRWRDPDGYRQVFRAVRARAVHGVQHSDGRAQQRAIADLKFLFRNLRSVLSPVAWEQWGDHYPDGATPEDHRAIVHMVGTAEGLGSAALAERWLDRQPGAFSVVRGPGGRVRGVIGLLDLTAASAADRAADPGTAAAWAYVERTAPARAGERVTQCRFVVDAEAYLGPSPTLNAVPILTMQAQLTNPRLAWDFVTLAEPDRWDAYFAAADLPRAVGADFVVDGRSYGLFAHDFRRVPVEVMTQRWTERALADDALLLPANVPEPDLLVLSHPDFEAAVRRALKDLHRPDLLARNPLLRTRLVSAPDDAPVAAGADALAGLLRTAVASLSTHPRDDPLYRALDRTYLHGSHTQEATAATLGLPFSTYRRHLRLGLDRVVAWLWQRELGSTEPR